MDECEPDVILSQRIRWFCIIVGTLALIAGLAILALGRGGREVTAGMGLLFTGAGVLWLGLAAPAHPGG